MFVKSAEEIGIKSSCVESFLDEIERQHLCLHSFVLMRGGCIGAEGYWAPFRESKPHRMYSVTKTFVAAAIGVLAGEGKLCLEDKITSFFPEYADTAHPYVAMTTVRDLLVMASPYSGSTYDIGMTEWLRSYFTSTPDHCPGTVYKYDSCGSYVLGSIVKRVSGKPFMEFLKEKVLLRIGFSDDAHCIEGPDGECWAGSGAMITTRELALFTQLLLNKGEYNGEQLIARDFVEDMTSALIPNVTDGTDYSYLRGYGYQTWITRDNAIYLNGMAGQIGIAFPETGLVFACTADIQVHNSLGKHMIYEALWNNIASKISAPMAKDASAHARLCKRCDALCIHPYEGTCHSPYQATANGKKYVLSQNRMGITDIELKFDGNTGRIDYTNERGKKSIEFGLGYYKEGIFPENHYPGKRLGVPLGYGYPTINCGTWLNDTTLMIRVYATGDYIGMLNIVLAFSGDKIGVHMSKAAQFFFDEYSGYAGGKLQN